MNHEQASEIIWRVSAAEDAMARSYPSTQAACKAAGVKPAEYKEARAILCGANRPALT